jgi:tRNA pseudouridine-54 N-methylase
MMAFTGLRFIGIYSTIQVDAEFNMKDLTGAGRRIDVLCRSLEACFDWAADRPITASVEYVAVLEKEIVLRFTNPGDATGKGETWWAGHIRDALRDNPPPFVRVARTTLEQFLEDIREESSQEMFVLEEKGRLLKARTLEQSPSQYSFILGDHRGFSERTRGVFQSFNIPSISLGPKSYLGSHCVAAVISELERRGQ